MKKLLIVVIFLLHNTVFAQTLTGRVSDEKRETLPGATVFLTHTQFKTATNNEGNFALHDLPAGSYEVVVKMLGFEAFIQKITISDKPVTLNIVLKEESKQLNEVSIIDRARPDRNRAVYLKNFLKYFIGESTNAGLCKLLNPEVLHFKYNASTDILIATASDLLKIENQGLGYRISYLLNSFTLDSKKLLFNYSGYPYFETLNGSERQKKRWDKARQVAYYGSAIDFFRSVYYKKAADNGFAVYVADGKNLSASQHNIDSLFIDNYNGFLKLKAKYNRRSVEDTTNIWVYYKDSDEPFEYSGPGHHTDNRIALSGHGQLSKLIPLKPEVLVGKDGVTELQNDFLISGYWAWNKIAEQMPLDYHRTGQTDSLNNERLDISVADSLIRRIRSRVVHHPTEKVHLQLNKPNYEHGDTIWFKAYTTVGSYHQPSALSGVLHVELRNEQDRVIQSLQLNNNNGLAKGNFVLNSTVPVGNYRICAYTNWMRNENLFFTCAIRVNDAATSALFVTPELTLGNDANTKTKLSFTDRVGRVFSDKPVIYEVRADTDFLYKGTSVTDDRGNITFTFPGKTAPHQRIRVMSHITVAAGTIVTKITELNVSNPDADVQFFPESGILVNGVRSKVAFKAIGTNGLGIDISGIVTDDSNNEVAEFASQHKGMGVFAFTPQAGKTYTAKIKLSEQCTITRPLPAARDKGFVLSINDNPEDTAKLNIRLSTNEATLHDLQNALFYIIGQTGGQVYFTSAGKLDNLSFIIPVAKSKFPTGVAQFTLFTDKKQPQNERIIFIHNPADQLKLSLHTDKPTYHGKEKVNLQLSANDNNDKPVQGSFSLTVYNESTVFTNDNAENNILTELLLTSDLRGSIEDPGYYFDQANKETNANLDILMLSQGYRRFLWEEALAETEPPIAYRPEKSLTLTGTLTDGKSKPIAGGKIKALSLAAKIAMDTTADEQGRFTLTNLNINDSTKLVLQARMPNGGKDVTIKVDSKTTPGAIAGNKISTDQTLLQSFMAKAAISPIKADSNSIVTGVKNNAFRFNKENTLKEVKITQQRNNNGTDIAPWTPTVTHSANLNGPGRADQVLTYKDLAECTDLVSCLLVKIPGIIGGIKGLSFVRHSAQSIGGNPSIVFIVDGAFIGTDPQAAEGVVNVNNIMTIEVLKSNSYLTIYGSTASFGAIVITTKAGNEGTPEWVWQREAPGIITSLFKGFDVPKQFYVPKYTPANSSIPDTRDAIYWNPSVQTDTNGKATLEFFNSDVKGAYKIVVEGIDNEGRLGHAVYAYEVK